MRILLTRPREDSERLAETLSARGHDVLIEPLFSIHPDLDAALDLDGVQALLLTSANGARAFALRSARRDLKVLAVGDATAAAARGFGFADVESASGDVADLTRLVRARLRPEDGTLLHAAGSVVAGDLAGDLEAGGFAVRRTVLYRAEPVDRLSDATCDALRAGEIDLAVFFSPRTAATFVSLARAAGVDTACAGVVLLGLSPAVTAAAGELPWRARLTASEPTEAALLEAIDRHAAELQPAPAHSERETMTDTTAPSSAPPPQPAPPAPQRRGWAAPVALALVLALGALGWTAWRELQPQPAADTARLDAIAQRLGALERDAAARVGALERDMSTRLAALERDSASRTAAAEQARAAAESRAAALDERLGAIEGRIAAVAGDAEKVAARVAQLEQEPRTPGDPARLAMLTAENRRLGLELGRLQEEVVALNATLGERAEARRTDSLALALGQLREALARGGPYAPELATARAIAGEDNAAAQAMAPLAAHAARGVPTRDALKARFDDVAVGVVRAAQVPADEAWWRPLWDRVGALVSIRPVGEVAGDDPAAIVARAEHRLASGDLAGAVTELEALQGPAAEPARAWIEDARARLGVEGALATLTGQALRAGGSGVEPKAMQ